MNTYQCNIEAHKTPTLCLCDQQNVEHYLTTYLNIIKVLVYSSDFCSKQLYFKGVYCEDITVGNGTVIEDSPYPVDANITFKCDYGYDLEGADKALCLLNGTWSKKLPQCNRKLNKFYNIYCQSTIINTIP